MIDEPKKIGNINIFLPTSIDQKSIVDCGPKFAETSIAQGIFNEDLSCNKLTSNKGVELQQGAKSFCQVHWFSIEKGLIDTSELIVTKKAEGSIITITQQAISSLTKQNGKNSRSYFRLRVFLQDAEKNPFLNLISPADRIWNSSIDQIEYIDFRLNEARTLPNSIEDMIRQAKYGIAHVKLVAFLTAVPVNSAVASSNEQWRKSRLLEHDIWREYVDAETPKGMVVYHWKRSVQDPDQSIGDFSSFVKLQTRRSGGSILATYLMVAFLFGVFGNLAANGLQSLWTQYICCEADSANSQTEIGVVDDDANRRSQ